MKVIVAKRFGFSASHTLPYHKGKCRQLHGHNYLLEVGVVGGIQGGDQPKEGGTPNPEAGMVIDFGNLSVLVKQLVLDVYDHQHLNEFFENPTAEVVAHTIFVSLAAAIHEAPNVIQLNGGIGRELEFVRLWETDDSYAEVSLWRK